MFGALNFTFNRRNICLAISATVLKNYFCLATSKKKVVLNCFYMHFNRPRKTLLNYEFLLCLKMDFVGFKNYFLNPCRLQHLKVHKIENFFGFDFEFCTISMLVFGT
jgi:hypothetical protein